MKLPHATIAAAEQRLQSVPLPPPAPPSAAPSAAPLAPGAEFASSTSGSTSSSPANASTATPTTVRSIARRAAYLSVGGVTPSKSEQERILGTNDLVDEFYLLRALLAAQPVARLNVRSPQGKGFATGFMISPRLLLTNWHVFPAAAAAVQSVAEFNYRDDVAGNPEPFYTFRLRPDLFFHSFQGLDFAVVSVEPKSIAGDKALASFGYHRLIPTTGKVSKDEWLTIIQHPGGARRQFAIRENQCISTDEPDALLYKSDTAQGSSGSPVLNDSFLIAALHHAGRARRDAQGLYILKDGRKVPSIEGLDDSLVDWTSNAGIRISRICAALLALPDQGAHITELKAAMEGSEDVLSRAFRHASAGPLEGLLDGHLPATTLVSSSAGNGVHPLPPAQGQGLQLPVNLDLRLSLYGQPLVLPGTFQRAAAPAPAPSPPPAPAPAPGPLPADASAVERLIFLEPKIDDQYENRTGFNTWYLMDEGEPENPALVVELPTPAHGITAPVREADGGGHELKYEHFSVFMHKTRRLALLTASNVDWNGVSRRPEEGRDYGRKALNGFPAESRDIIAEKWVIDRRMEPRFQVPDSFYTEDRGAFDKGHVVRRDDVCWGYDYAEVQRANGDTFHLTNCTPQVKGFNQSGSDGIWGDLENEVQRQGKQERYCIFAGPVFDDDGIDDDDDRTFRGRDEEGRILRVKIPQRYWKMIIARRDNQLEVFAFVLRQDLSAVPLEFDVTATWRPHQVSVSELEATLGGTLTFPANLHAADTHQPAPAPEIAPQRPRPRRRPTPASRGAGNPAPTRRRSR